MSENEAAANKLSLELLSAFELTCGGNTVPLPLGAQRLLAYLALRPEGVHRGATAQQLWPDHPCHRAAANLRSALCQGRRVGCVTMIDCIGQRLRLSPVVHVDLLWIRDSARRIIDGFAPSPADSEACIEQFTRELLPGWTDEWLHADRENWDQMRLYALEGLAQRLLTAQQYLSALRAALAATAIDPIRETAHRTVIEIHLAEGNIANAVRCYQHYKAYVQHELDVSPSPQMAALLKGLPCMERERQRHSAPPKTVGPVLGRRPRKTVGSRSRDAAATLSERYGQRWNDGPKRDL
ncbi:AfsR/SARP family transcriptional regulator [Streptomyces griseoaurantiacus]|uniref:AfsR/SARP family transcriptional regulator n=1 Tax=Streptomyces griseoaurantiacus TaxID=68213 RepID=UPI0036C75345